MHLKKVCWDRVFLGIAVVTLVATIIFTRSSDTFGESPFTFLKNLRSDNHGSDKQVTSQRVVEEESAVTTLVEESSPAVVSIVLKLTSFDPLTGPISEESGIGTGFIIESDGLILTNRHVVSLEEGEYTVVTGDQKTYLVKEIHRDPVNDLAILRIEASDLPVLALGDSGVLKVGQTVVAIGNALGRYGNTVTKGVVSGLGRGVVAQQGLWGPSEQLDDVIQTDAALNPGNSGGPLLNLSGQVVGINVAISQGAQNIGFAVPSNAAKPVIEQFKQWGRIIRPYLGVEYVQITPDIAAIRHLSVGAFISRVLADSPAEKAKLVPYDIITKFDGLAVTSENTLAKLIHKHSVGDTIEITVDRNGEGLTLTITLEERDY